MNKLNPFNKEDTLSMTFSPPNKDFYNNIQDDNFAWLLIYDATTDEGQKIIAQYYGVYNEWVALEHCNNKINRYYDLLLGEDTEQERYSLGQFR